MKIAQVCPYDFSRHGGVKTHILQLSDALRNLGHEVHIIAPKGAKTISHQNLHCFGKNFGLLFLGTKIDVNAALWSERVRLKKFLELENFDLIHFHTVWNPLLSFQILFLSKARKVATFHDTPKNNWIGKFLGSYVMPVMARLVFMKLDGIISVSKSQVKLIDRFSNRKIAIIPNGITIPLSGSGSSTLRDPNQLLFLGRLEPRKGVISALKVFQLIKEGNPSLKLLVVGDGDQRDQAESFVREANLADVKFLGSVDDEQKWKLFQSSSIYLATAEYGESFGIVLVEAMAMGTLIAGFSNDGYKNVLSEKQLQFFSEPQDYVKLAELLQRLYGNLGSNKTQDLLIEGKKIAENYNWKLLVDRVCQVYQDTK